MDASSIIQLFLSANAQLYHFFLPGASAKFLILTSLESQTRTTEYLRLEGTHQHHCCLQIYIKLNHLIKSLIQMLLEHCQAWCWDQFPGKSLPGTNHLLSEEPFPNVQAELPLMQLHSISSCPATSDQRDEISTSPLLPPKRNVNTPPGWTSSAISAAPHKSCPQNLSPFWSPFSWYTLTIQCPYVLILWHPKPSPGLEVRPHECRAVI